MSNCGIASFHHHTTRQLNAGLWVASRFKKPAISSLLRHIDWYTVHTIEHHPKKFETLIKERPFLMAQYRVQTAHLIQLANQLDKYDPKLVREIEKTLKMTTLLKKIYLHLDEPDDVIRANIDIDILEAILHRIQNLHRQGPSILPLSKVSFGQQLRSLHMNTNLSRLTAIRIRRFILTSTALQTFITWRPTVAQIEAFTSPFFLYLAWLFFFPRLLLNLATLCKKWLFTPHSQLPWHLRLEAHFNLHRRLYELWTDSVWFTSGILLCFVLFGPLALWRPIVTIGVQMSDVFMMMTRSFIELRRLFILKNEYFENIKHQGVEKNPTYLAALEERITFEKKVSYLAITNNLLMSIGFLSLLPMVAALHPLLPVLGATIGILTTLRFFTMNAANEAQAPRMNLNLLLKNYDSKASSTPASAPAPSLLNKLAIPGVLVLTPLIFIGCTFSPVMTALLCISLVILVLRRTQEPTEAKQIRPLSKLAATSEIRRQAGAQNRSVHVVHEDSSTALTPNFAVAVEFRKRSIKKNHETVMNHHFFKTEQTPPKPVEPQPSIDTPLRMKA